MYVCSVFGVGGRLDAFKEEIATIDRSIAVQLDGFPFLYFYAGNQRIGRARTVAANTRLSRPQTSSFLISVGF